MRRYAAKMQSNLHSPPLTIKQKLPLNTASSHLTATVLWNIKRSSCNKNHIVL